MRACNRVSRFVVAFALGGFVMTGPASATSAATDTSDIWWTPGESGWGMQLVHTGTFIFATVFIYGADGKPTWITGELQADPNNTYTGPAYVNSGPFYGGPWTSGAVTQRQAGTMTFALQYVESGQLTYSVDGVVVNKNVERQPLTLDSYAGSYVGTVTSTASGCTNPAGNVTVTNAGSLKIAQDGTATTVVYPIAGNGSCTINGTYSQLGRNGRVDGPYTCTTGEAGTAIMFQMNNNNPSMFMARLYLQSPGSGCTTSGQVVALIPY